MEDPEGKGPRLFFQKVPEGKTAKNRMHMDLNASAGPGTPFEEKKRLEEHGSYWVRMNDPEGTSSACSK